MIHNEENPTNSKDRIAESTILTQINALARQIELSFPGARTELRFFPSGAAMLDIYWQDKLFVLAYSPADGFGVDEVKEGDFFGMGYSFCTKSFYLAADRINKLMLP
jgi:hypothetical protein